jgi:hypothetical protein
MSESFRIKRIKLTTGEDVTVRAVPPHLTIQAAKAHPLPEPPLIDIESQLPGGGKEKFLNDKDPEYLRKLAEARRARADYLNEVQWLYSLPDIQLPSEDYWKVEIEEAMPEVKWRQGARGRKLDYIEYIILGCNEDVRRVREAMDEVNGIQKSQELLESVEDAFRGDVRGQALEDNREGATAR